MGKWQIVGGGSIVFGVKCQELFGRPAGSGCRAEMKRGEDG